MSNRNRNLRNDLDMELIKSIGGRPTKQEIVQFMRDQWSLYDRDFFGFRVEKGDIFSYHHTRVAACKEGPITIYNGSILSGYISHPFLHTIGDHDKDMFKDLTKILIEINEQRHFPTPTQTNRADEIFSTFEREHSGDTNNKGNPLIRECYTRRLIR